MLDLKNREYKKVEAYVPNDCVVFTMKNGLAYMVNSWRKKIYIDTLWWNFFKQDPYYEDGSKIPKEELDKALEVLKTAELPRLNESEVRRLERFLKANK